MSKRHIFNFQVQVYSDQLPDEKVISDAAYGIICRLETRHTGKISYMHITDITAETGKEWEWKQPT